MLWDTSHIDLGVVEISNSHGFGVRCVIIYHTCRIDSSFMVATCIVLDQREAMSTIAEELRSFYPSNTMDDHFAVSDDSDVQRNGNLFRSSIFTRLNNTNVNVYVIRITKIIGNRAE